MSLQKIAAKFGIKNKLVIKRVLLEQQVTLRTEQENRLLGAASNKATCLEKYGVENVFQLTDTKDKSKLTRLERYGDENYRNQAQIVQTCLERYGTTNGGWIPSAQEKIIATNRTRFGMDWSLQSEEVQKKAIITNRARYGCDYASQTPAFQKQLEQTMLAHYGVRRFAQTPEFHLQAQHKYCYETETFDSFPELAVYVYAIEHGIEVKRCPQKIKYVFNNIEHYYIPDFLYGDTLLEVKGAQFLKEDGSWQCPFDHSQDELFEAKHQCALQNNVCIWYSDDYLFATQYFESKYNKATFCIK